MFNVRQLIWSSLIAVMIFSYGFGDVRVEFDSVNVLTPQFYNTTSQPVQLGGWRFFTRTFHWMNISVTGALMNQKERTVNGYIETEAAFDKSTQETITKLVYTGGTPTSKSLGYSWISNGEFPQTQDPYEPYILLKTGSSGVPDDPVDEGPITLVQLDSLMKTPNFYNANYRYKDSLGVNGGKYSGGFLDTWLGKTQVQIPITKTTFVLSNTTLRFHPDITNGPMYWMTLAMGQEYFHVDMQWMMGFGAKESFAGVVIDATGQGNYIGTNLDGAYGAFEVESPTGTDRAIAYPKFFPEYSQALSSAAAVAALPFTPAQFCSDYMGATETPINSPYVVNSYVFSITCQYSLYDLLSYAEDFCWKEVLSQCKDPYVGLGAMAPLYNLGMWGVASIAAPLHVSRYQATIPNPLARDLFPTGNSNYRPNILTAIQALIDASSQSVTNPGSITIWDSPITLDDARAFFLGEGGTVNTQGKGGLLKHFYVKEIATRTAIMNTVEAAFNMLKGHAPSTLGTNNISFRYDWLALLRTVKGYFDCTRKRPAGGDIVIKINENSVVGGCSGEAPDYSYPYGEVTGKMILPGEFVATIAATDNKLIKEVKWTTEYNWTWWLAGDSVSGTGGSKIFELHVDTSLYDGIAGDTLWYMVTDGSGNSIVRTTMIEGVKYPTFDSSIIEDTRGNGVGNQITVFIRRAVGDSADELSEFLNLKYSWPTQTNLISAAGNVTVSSAGLVISDNSLTGGAGLGRVTFDYPSKYGYAGDVLDRVGPALFKGTAVLKAKQNAADPDSLVVNFTEPVREPLQNNTMYLNFFPQGQKTSLAAVKENALQWVFVFASGSVKGNDSVNLVPASGITDTVGNKPHTGNQRVPIIIQEGSYRIIDGVYCDANGDGIMDSLAVTFDRTIDQAALAAMTFTFKWPDAGGAVTTMTVKGSDFTLSGGIYAAWRVSGYSLRQYVTSKGATWGQATLTQPALSGGTTTVDITVRDGMAPVIVSADYYAFNSPTIDDSLIVTFSENMGALGSEARPFKFWTSSDPEYLVDLREGSTANNRMTLYVLDFVDNIVPSAGDSIWIYANHNVKDVPGNIQAVDDNIKQPLRVYSTFTVRSAAYLDTDARPDGYIDVIRVTLNAAPKTFDFSTLASAITLPPARYFSGLSTGSFTATASGFDIRVVQSKTNIPYDKVNTAVEAGDKFIISTGTGIGSNSMLLPASIAVTDSLAPVIIKGTFCPKLQNGNPGIRDTLIVTFSETVIVPGVNEPFKFFDISGAFPANYSMTLTPMDNTPHAVMTFLVDNTQKTYPQNEDSLWIMGDAQIKDTVLIVQTRYTKPAPLFVKPIPFIILSAAYLDTDTRPDGYIDVIRVTLNAAPNTFDFSTLASAITLPPARYFSGLSTGSFTATASGFDIGVVQSKTNIPYDRVNTAVDAGDKFIISTGTGIGNNSMLLPAAIAITDSLAPVIIKGVFHPKLEKGVPGMRDTLIVTFSETVIVPGVQEPFKFFDISGAFPANYSMTLTPRDNTSNAILAFLVDNTQKTYPQNGDSLWIVSGAQMEDNVSIIQARDTKPARLIVKPYPLIITITALNPLSLADPGIHPNLVGRYDLGAENKGALVIADISGHIEDPSRLSARLDIIDVVGNIVKENITARLVEYIVNNNKRTALVMVWDLRNRNSRLVGPAPYCAVITVKNGASVIEHTRIIIGVQE